MPFIAPQSQRTRLKFARARSNITKSSADEGDSVQFMDSMAHRLKLASARLPESWCRVEVKCPACGRLYVGQASPREDLCDGRQAARRRLLLACPDHAVRFQV